MCQQEQRSVIAVSLSYAQSSSGSVFIPHSLLSCAVSSIVLTSISCKLCSIFCHCRSASRSVFLLHFPLSLLASNVNSPNRRHGPALLKAPVRMRGDPTVAPSAPEKVARSRSHTPGNVMAQMTTAYLNIITFSTRDTFDDYLAPPYRTRCLP
jgi:hypothetical protein